MQRTAIRLVWLKRDLRVVDHRPLWEACRLGPTVVLYVFEPQLWAMPEMDRSHFDFIVQSLIELSEQLEQRGGRLAIRVGELPDVFDYIQREYDIVELYSHEETGNRFTYQRDKRVAKWARQSRIAWHQFPQNGVVRVLKNRDGWAEHLQKRMDEPTTPAPDHIPYPTSFQSGWSLNQQSDTRYDLVSHGPSGDRSISQQLGLAPSRKTDLQIGGSTNANKILESFLSQRGLNYQKGMSSPVTSRTDCSRLSPYLAWGCISIKTVHQQLKRRRSEIRQLPKGSIEPRWSTSLNSFASRLAWHCHFMQKLEDEPEIEFQNISRSYDGLREKDFNEERFEAWKLGQTGYPMVDACMRALHETSWINFRMRAMLISFASNHLWLHWRPTSVFLAQHFLDFEPGIHFPQCQMQSGTTGINTVRIYSPAKQVLDQDPTGVFIRKYIPELAEVPDEFLPEPHQMPSSVQSRVGCIIGQDYPKPIVDHRSAYRLARDRIYAIRNTESAIAESQRVFKKHGSRKNRDPLPKSTKSKKSDSGQRTLFDDLE